MHKSKTIIIILTLTVLSFSLFCCCFQSEAQAKVEVPECHQTEQTNSEQNDANCDCSEVLSLAAKKSIEVTPFSQLKITQPDDSTLILFNQRGFINDEARLDYYSQFKESPKTTYPLYLQHSNLRL